MRRLSLLLLMLAAAAGAEAQIRLPSLPGLALPGTVQTLAPPASLDLASGLRLKQARQLIRENRKLIEADPDGEPIVRGEILASGASAGARAHLEARGFVVEREELMAAGGIRLLVLKIPPGMATRKALAELRAADPDGLYDYDHIYLKSGASADPLGNVGAAQNAARAGARSRVGLIDSGVDVTHSAFSGSAVHVFGCGGAPRPDAHGTAVASLLAARAVAEIYAADVYCGSPTGGSVDALAGAFSWLADERVAVINVSLVGPKNALLERIVRSLIEQGYLIVAAVGNDGPAAPPLYPAAYPDVVGVTGVDAHRRVLLEAERGLQVMFAARGADLGAADLKHGYAPVRGTSYAAPTVAALLAAAVSAPDRQAALEAILQLKQSAIHLGAPGKDLTYGFGLVGEKNR
jgi:subtilisin family serine protease